MLFAVLCILLLSINLSNAENLPHSVSDTFFISSDTTGPIFLNHIYSSNIELSSPDITLPRWNIIPSQNLLMFERTVPKNSRVIAIYNTNFPELTHRYRLYELIDKPSEVEHFEYSHKQSSKENPNKITLFGEKSISFSVGSSGESLLNQSLDLRLAGMVNDSTSISGHISDQNTSLQGDSREIGAIDRIYLALENPRWRFEAGDIRPKKLSSRLLIPPPEPKGISVNHRSKQFNGEGFIGISGNRYGHDTFIAKSNIQGGIFRLKGNSTEGRPFITPGTVSVSVDGKTLRYGEERGDFYVDYENGTLHFTPSYPIVKDARVDVRYRYNENEYDTYQLGLSQETRLHNLSIKGALFLEVDQFESSKRGLTTDEINQIKSIDNREKLRIQSGKAVHYNDIPIEEARERLYRKDKNGNYQWIPNPRSHHRGDTLFIVSFSKASNDENRTYREYRRDDHDILINFFSEEFLYEVYEESKRPGMPPIYLHLDTTYGTHTAHFTIPLPRRELIGELDIEWSPWDRLSINAVTTGLLQDSNTMNRSQKERVEGALDLTTEYTIASSSYTNFKSITNFSYKPQEIRKLEEGFHRERLWGFNDSNGTFSFWQQQAVATLNNRTTFNVTGGRSYHDESDFSSIVRGSVDADFNKVIQPSYSILYRTENRLETWRHNLDLLSNINDITLGFSGEFEERDFELREREAIDLSGVFKHNSVGVSQRYQYKRSIETPKKFGMSDTTTSHIWTQVFSPPPTPERGVVINHSYSKTLQSSIVERANLIRGDIHSLHNRGAFSQNTTFLSTVESALEKQWEYYKVPQGSGTHIRDPLTGIFIPSDDGNYLAREIVLYDSIAGRVVRNRVDIQWTYSPRSDNFLNSFHFSGSHTLQEEVSPTSSGFSASWIPGLTTLLSETEDSITYAYNSSNLRIEWRAPNIKDLNAKLFYRREERVQPGISIENHRVRSEVDKRVRRLTLGLALPIYFEERKTERELIELEEYEFAPFQQIALRGRADIRFTEFGGLFYINEDRGEYTGGEVRLQLLSNRSNRASISHRTAYVNYNEPIPAPLAQSFSNGWNQRSTLNLSIKAGERTDISGNWRSDYQKDNGWLHQLSLNAHITF